jgi:hypothetical protein
MQCLSLTLVFIIDELNKSVQAQVVQAYAVLAKF